MTTPIDEETVHNIIILVDGEGEGLNNQENMEEEEEEEEVNQDEEYDKYEEE